MATIFFATNGTEWFQRDGWLDYSMHECDWYTTYTNGEVCGQPLAVTMRTPGDDEDPSELGPNRAGLRAEAPDQHLDVPGDRPVAED